MEISESLDKRRKQQKNYLILVAIIFIIAILVEAVLFFIFNEGRALIYLVATIILAILVIGSGWLRFVYQYKKDSSQTNKPIDKVMTGINIYEGVTGKIYSEGYAIGGIIFLLGGVYSIFAYRDWKMFLGVLFILMGLGLFYVSVNEWKVSKIRMQGRNY